MPQFELPETAFPFLRDRIVFCGFSGGSDSLYLLLALKKFSEPLHFQLRAVHFEHGFRGEESRADAAWCEKKCLAEGIPFQCIELHSIENRMRGEGDEAAARRLRLMHWKKLTEQYPDSIVVLGHHSGDLAENLFLRLFRGSNASGLASMRGYSVIEGFAVLRPLLGLSKQKIESVLRENGESWRLDSTNLSDSYGRNFLRLKIFPLLEEKFPFAHLGILHSLDSLEQDADFLEKTAHSEYEKMREADHFAPEYWRALHPAVRCRVLRLFLTHETGHSMIPDRNLLERFSSAVSNPPETGTLFLDLKDYPGFYLCVEKEKVFLLVRGEKPEKIFWDWKNQPQIRFAGYELSVSDADGFMGKCDSGEAFFGEELPSSLIVDVRHDGDRMVPFGKKDPVLLKKLYNDAGVKAYERNLIPVVKDSSGNILWIPCVKRSAFFLHSGKKGIRIRAKKL